MKAANKAIVSCALAALAGGCSVQPVAPVAELRLPPPVVVSPAPVLVAPVFHWPHPKHGWGHGKHRHHRRQDD